MRAYENRSKSKAVWWVLGALWLAAVGLVVVDQVDRAGARSDQDERVEEYVDCLDRLEAGFEAC